MTYKEIQSLYGYLCGYQQSYNDHYGIINKYNIRNIEEKVTIRKALEFIKDVWGIDFYFYDKLTRYARRFHLLDEEDKDQRNWKLRISYENIFKLMMTPLYELFLLQQKNKDK